MNLLHRLSHLLGISLIVAAITSVSFLTGYARGYERGQAQVGTGASGSRAESATIIDRIKQYRLTTNDAPTAEEAAHFRVFWEAWNLLKKEYYGTLPNSRELTYQAIRGVLQGLEDPYTSFLPPENADILQSDMEGGFDGIGARVNLAEGGGIEIVEPYKDQPAWEAGLRRGDIILAVDGQDVTTMTLLEAIRLIRGPEGSQVILTVYRPSEDHTFEVGITRRRIEFPIVTAQMLDGHIAYLSLAEFNAVAKKQTRDALGKLLDQNPTALVFDLRANPGGFLASAIDIASFFVAEGNILLERYSDGQIEEHPRRGELVVPASLPLVVLVDRASASAAEIVAGAIQDAGRGLLVGERTFGKGSVQLPHTLSDKSMLRITIARWETPLGRQIHGQGLTPEIEVTLTEDDIAQARDPQLACAIHYLQTGEAECPPFDEDPGNEP